MRCALVTCLLCLVQATTLKQTPGDAAALACEHPFAEARADAPPPGLRSIRRPHFGYPQVMKVLLARRNARLYDPSAVKLFRAPITEVQVTASPLAFVPPSCPSRPPPMRPRPRPPPTLSSLVAHPGCLLLCAAGENIHGACHGLHACRLCGAVR